MKILHVEKLGGLANFGGAHARIRSRGQIDTEALSTKELQAVESLFHRPGKSKSPVMPDSFRFRISRITATGTETVEVPESSVPAILASCVKDEFV